MNSRLVCLVLFSACLPATPVELVFELDSAAVNPVLQHCTDLRPNPAWAPVAGAAVTPLGNDRFKAAFTELPGDRHFFRLAAETGCPDSRYVAHEVRAVSSSSFELQVETARDLPLRVCYHPSTDPSQISYRRCEFSDRFGSAGREHVQDITGLAPATAYTVVIQSSADVGTSPADCDTMAWEDISCPIQVTTAAAGIRELSLADFSGSPLENASEGNFTSPSAPGDNQQIRVRIQPQSHWGASGKYLLDPSVKEAWASWCMKLDPNWSINDGAKMPGFTSHVNGGSGGIAGGNGGGWAGLCKSWSARTLIDNPGGQFSDLLRIYLYHLDNRNDDYAGASADDHPCIVNPGNPQTNPNQRRFGNMVGSNDPAARVLGDGEWHCITQHIKLNTLNPASNDPGQVFRDGETRLYIDGQLTGEKTGIHFTNNPDYHNIAFWLQVYHGGSGVADSIDDVYFDSIRISEGPINNTPCACAGDDNPPPPPPPPPPPDGLATPQNLAGNVVASGVALSWNAVPNADGYSIYRDGEWLRSQSGTAYTDTTAASGTTYRYKVTAWGGDPRIFSPFTDEIAVGGGGGDAFEKVGNPLTNSYTESGQINRTEDAAWGNWGAPAPPSGERDWLKVPINKDSFWGVGHRNPLFDGTEGWMAYSMRLVNWNQSKYATKLPGPSARLTIGHQKIESASDQASYDRVVGGSGGGGSERSGGPNGLGKSWSARMTIGAVVTDYTSKGELAYELYHSDSTNIRSDGRQFGDSEKWRVNGVNSAQILDEDWHDIKHYIKLNDIGQNNGILRGYFDGSLAYERTDIHFTDDPQFRQVAMFLNVYHGGSTPATDDFTFYMDNIRYNAGPVDRTGP